jgi:hypothetical protein
MKPGLFIIGAPKCGTTSMCAYLAQHPQICFSVPKEPKFFHSDFAEAHRGVLDEGAYLRCFKPDLCRHRMLAEGTVWYLYSKAAVPNILEFNPDARFVVMIRNPVDLAYALHSQLVYGGDEDVEDFDTAWRLQDARRRGESLPPGARDFKSLLYGDVAKLGEQVERLFSTVDRQRVLIVNYDDFSTDPQSEFERVLAFAGLPAHHCTAFDRRNENRVLRKSILTEAMFRMKRLKNVLGLKKSFGLWRLLQPLVARKEPRAALPQPLRAELQEYFRADVEKLEILLDLDLSGWKQSSR